MLIVYLVGLLAGIDQILYALFDGAGALSYFLNNLLVTGRELISSFYGEDNSHIADVLQQLCLVAGGNGNDVVHREVTEYTGFYLDLLRVGLPLHFIAGLQLLLGHHAKALEHPNAGIVQIAFKDFRARLLYVQSALGSLFHPLV